MKSLSSFNDRQSIDHLSGSLGYLSGRWIRLDEMALSLDDLGFRQAVTIVERLRTYDRKPFQLDAHLDRWAKSVDALSIAGLPTADEIGSLTRKMLERNAPAISILGDVGITWFATPGVLGHDQPTLAIHINRLDHGKNRQRRLHGQPLVITDVQQPSGRTWPRWIKTRCRLHYYLADTVARQQHPDAVGVLVDDDGSVTETSIANIAIVESGQIISPPPDQVLPGITQAVVETIARDVSIRWTRDRISVDRFNAADEALMMGTDTGLWFVNQIEPAGVSHAKPGEVYQKLINRSIWAG